VNETREVGKNGMVFITEKIDPEAMEDALKKAKRKGFTYFEVRQSASRNTSTNNKKKHHPEL